MLKVTPSKNISDISPGSFTQFQEYRTWRPNGSQDWLLIYTFRGMGECAIGGRKKHLQPGDLLLFEPNIPQEYGTAPSAGKWSLHWSHFQARDHWQRWFSEYPTAAPGIRFLHLPEGEIRLNFEKAFREVLEYFQSTLSLRKAFCLNSLEKALLWVRTLLSDDPWPQLDSRIRKSMTSMEQAISAPLSLGALAGNCNLSVSRFSHLFREETGITPHQFQENLRLTRARQLLETTSLRIGEIAREVGYEDPFYFSNRFKKRFKSSPSALRKGKLSK